MSVDTPCREYPGYRNHAGYGIIRRRGKTYRLHRYIWSLVNGPIPDGVVIMHRCDNPPCFRLDHLTDGTQLDNIADRDAKGRQRSTQSLKTHCPQGHSYSGDNLCIEKDGTRKCKTCRRSNERRRHAALVAACRSVQDGEP